MHECYDALLVVTDLASAAGENVESEDERVHQQRLRAKRPALVDTVKANHSGLLSQLNKEH